MIQTSKAIIEKVIDLEHVDDYYAAKIADILPMHPDDVRSYLLENVSHWVEMKLIP